MVVSAVITVVAAVIESHKHHKSSKLSISDFNKQYLYLGGTVKKVTTDEYNT